MLRSWFTPASLGRPRPSPCGSSASCPALVPAARLVVQQIETGPPIGVPVQVRIQGQDLATIERLGEQVKGFMREFPGSTDIQDDWDPQILQLALQVDTDRANLAGITHQDVASLMGGGLSGTVTTRIRERDRLIPVTLKLRPDERSRVEDLMTLEAHGAQSGHRVPLDQVGAFRTEMVRPKVMRRDNERCLDGQVRHRRGRACPAGSSSSST